MYCGFPSRMHECFYLSMVEKALQLMSSRLLAFYNSGKSSLLLSERGAL